MSSKKNLSVALLLNDISTSKEISDIFRKVGVVAHFYETLESFWQGTLDSIPSLCVVDVKKMSEGNLLLKNHPLVKSEQLPLVFFHNSKNEPLLYSTFELFNLGFIKEELSLESQIKSILKRFNKVLKLEKNELNLSIESSKLNKQVAKLVEANEVLREKEFYREMMTSWTNRFEAQRNIATSFFNAVDTVFSTIKEIEGYSALELSPNGQKLFGMDSVRPKFVRIPPVFLGKTCTKGIETFAQNMGSQIAVDLLGGDLMCLNIRGTEHYPDKIIYLKVDSEELLENFDWQAFERYLSGINSFFAHRDGELKEREGLFMSPWEFMSVLDDFSLGKSLDSQMSITEEYCLIDVGFTDLVDMARAKFPKRFFWSKFIREFWTQFDLTHRFDFSIVNFGVEHVALLVNREQFDKLYDSLKVYSVKFSYWRYFEDAEVVLAKSMRPDIKMIPFSSEAYLSMLENIDFRVINEIDTTDKKKKNHDLIWGSQNTRSTETTM